jgi:3-hydroxyisobutyrate dehydrogenase-like beta-hydroxyacid dehydrogenase
MFRFLKKKTREEQVQSRTESVFAELISEAEFEFTELETVQIINNVRRRLSEHLEAKKDSFYEQSTISQQKAKEISGAIEYL